MLYQLLGKALCTTRYPLRKCLLPLYSLQGRTNLFQAGVAVKISRDLSIIPLILPDRRDRFRACPNPLICKNHAPMATEP